jgi:Na+/H+ antiporter NhaD/arsenite permease-like protein
VLEKIVALGILAFTLGLVMTEKVHRTVAAIIGAMMVVLAGLLTPAQLLDLNGPVHWEALGLIFGMFVMISILKKGGFFRWIGLKVLMAARFKIVYVFLLFSGLSAVLAAFMDSITVLLFMASLTMEITVILKISPVPFIMGEITSANIGGCATMVGDPPNIIMGTALHLSFIDFVTNLGPIAVVVFLVNLAFFYLYYQKELKARVDSGEFYKVYKYLMPKPEHAIKDQRTMRIALSIFIFSLVLLVFHQALGLSVAFIGILGAVLTMLIGGGKLPKMVERIDWRSIIFFAGLFVVVGGLVSSGVTDDIANGIEAVAGNNLAIGITLILWVASALSMFIDNVPMAATMVPIVQKLSSHTGMTTGPLVWATCIACDVAGNATPIGASANIVGLSVEEKGGVHQTWKQYCRAALPSTLLCLVVCNILLVLRYVIL